MPHRIRHNTDQDEAVDWPLDDHLRFHGRGFKRDPTRVVREPSVIVSMTSVSAKESNEHEITTEARLPNLCFGKR